MAAGEYVSVHSQSDTERADLRLEELELKADPKSERQELAAIYVARGLQPDLADHVAQQLMANNALEAHARDELGITEAMSARAIQAALVSALSFAVGAAVPLLVVGLIRSQILISVVSMTSLVCLGFLGSIAAWTGGARILPGTFRVMFWGVLAMAATFGVGAVFGTTVS
jgi:VIT1/CCC1 family predicted Fe2+/Mn2+ transporter